MNEPVRVGLIGLGWWGTTLAKGIEGTDALDLVACYARTAESREAFAATHGCRAADSFESLLADQEIDGVLLATPHSVHLQQIESAAAHGSHVFVDKPMTLTVAAARRAVEAAQDAGVVLQVGHNRRRQAPNRRIRQMIDAGELGMVHLLEGSITVPKDQMPRLGWRSAPQESPVGGMTALGVHMIDTFRYLAGPIRQVQVRSKQLWGAGQLDDVTTVMMEFTRGPLGYFSCSIVLPKGATTRVMGTAGAAWNEDDGERLYLQGKDELTRTEVPIDPVDTLVDQLEEFARCIATGTRPETDGVQGLEVAAVLEAIVASASDGHAHDVAEFRQP